jgi:hypothetical protein
MTTDDLVVATREKPYVVENGSIRQEYFYEDCVLTLRETMHGRTIELPVDVAVRQSFLDRLAMYYGPNAQFEVSSTPNS